MKTSVSWVQFLSRNRTGIAVCVLVFLSFLHLFFALRTHVFFSGDDFAVLAYIRAHTALDMTRTFLTQGDIWGFKKILGYLFFTAIFRSFGIQSLFFLLFNHLLHTINVILVFSLVSALTKDRLTGLFSGLVANRLYLFYFSNIHEYLALFFILISAWLFLKYPRYLYLSGLAFLLGLLTKEITLTFLFLMLAIVLLRKYSLTRVIPFICLSFIYLMFQALPFISRLPVSPDHPYRLGFPTWGNWLFYLNFPAIFLAVAIVIFRRRHTALPVLLGYLAAILPVLFLVNRREIYYQYIPTSFLAVLFGLVLPRISAKSIPVYLAAALTLGGRSLFPPVAFKSYPNWQLVSINNALTVIASNLASRPGSVNINLESLPLERDARLMLGSQVVDLFLPPALSADYVFNYNRDTHVLSAVKKSLH